MKKLLNASTLSLLIIISSVAQWTHQNSGTQKHFHNLYFISENLGWVCGDDGTILKTTNGGIDWNSQNIGTLDNVHAIFFIDSLFGWAVLYEFSPTRHGIIIHTTDGGNSWNVQLSIWDYTLHSIHFADGNNGWASGSNGIVFHTSNSGTSWIQQYPPTGGGWLWPIFFIDDNIGWTAGDPIFGVFKSTNGGNTWTAYNVPVIERIYSLMFLNYETGWLSAAQGQIAKSIDGGITWQNLQSGTSQYLRDIYFIDYNTGWCVGHNGTILFTTNGGSTWMQQSSNTFENLRAVQFVNDQVGWAVGENGTILKTVNSGIPVELISFSAEIENNLVKLSWITATENNNLGFEVERKIKNDWKKLAFIRGNGTTTMQQYYSYSDNISSSQGEIKIFYRLKQIDFNGSYKYLNEISVDLELTSIFNLEQNFPNPFNPTTTIKYSVGQNGFVTLKIFDVLGKEVATIVNSHKEAGSYKIEFDGNKLTNGIYYYMLKSNDLFSIKKFVLMK
jgi:photosystem II stability/assembly factor-like uncharacterized protein